MANTRRQIGIRIFALMQNVGMSHKDLEEKTGYTYRDICRILEGRMFVPPVGIEKIAAVLGRTKKELLEYDADQSVPELQYMKEFSNANNLDKVLDLLDEYIELKETV